MKRWEKVAVSVGVLVFVFFGLKFLAVSMPFGLRPDPLGAIESIPDDVFSSVSDCAHNQKNLYLSMEAYLQEHGELPADVWDIAAKTGDVPSKFFRCTECDLSYVVHTENWGKPGEVLIADRKDKHPNSFMLWFKGFSPQVQTMGDGTIHLFKDGKLLTIDATK